MPNPLITGVPPAFTQSWFAFFCATNSGGSAGSGFEARSAWQAPSTNSFAKYVRHRIMESAARCAFRQAQFFAHFGGADHACTHPFDDTFGAGHQLFIGRQHALIQP
jgi:hypothetical protein